METKRCPICETVKSVSEFHSYFSKSRNKHRIGNYCKVCARQTSKIRVQEYYQKNTEERLKYAKQYRKENPDKIKANSAKFTKKYREELKECYVAEFAAKALKCRIGEIRANPELLQAYKLNMQLKRTIKHHGTKQTNRSQ